ncbi:hypothetical protein [Emergencia sp. 1XD21-10]|uniref:hypothetical protein n=1 Tax=Emergencia sp. 1XD21-10 TaxID=2304569 RepID=UPI001379C83D|nr:hypothetical protein [Emergencia sp. 1XD21-10]NCE98234.1 hypothetical protein [Emergencia sp. 1XD21-10]
MKYIRLLCFDLVHGLLQKPLLFAAPVIICLTSCLDLSARTAAFASMDYFGDEIKASFGDFVMYIYGGLGPFPELSDSPVRWAAVFLVLCFLTLQYPYQDMQGVGQQILIRTKSRTAWWLSKCSWNLLSAAVYHSMIFLTAGLFCAGSKNAVFTGKIHKALLYEVFRVEKSQMAQDVEPWSFAMLFVPVFVSFGVSLAQMVLSLYLKPVFSFFGVALIMVSSAYCVSPYLIGNYAMTMRYEEVVISGVSQTTGLVLCLIMIFGCIVIGCWSFHRYDILNRD